MVDRDVTFNGTRLVADLGLHYSAFSEELPQPKTNIVSIPYGTDKDLTDAMGPIAYGNGTHTLVFMVYGDTEAERLAKKRAVLNLMHGVRADYSLSWDEDYVYTGRAKVSVAHLFDHADVLTITIDRAPMKAITEQMQPASVTRYSTTTRYSYYPTGSMAYDAVVTHKVAASLSYGGSSVATYEAKTSTTQEPAVRLTGDKTLIMNTSGWSWSCNDGYLTVTTAEATYADGDMTLDSSVWSYSGTNVSSSGVKDDAVLTLRRLDV